MDIFLTFLLFLFVVDFQKIEVLPNKKLEIQYIANLSQKQSTMADSNRH